MRLATDWSSSCQVREQSSTGEEEDDLVGVGAEVVRGAGDAGGSGDAAEAEDGGALDVGREGEPVDEAGVDGGGSDAGDGGEEDGGNVGGGDAERGHGLEDGLLAEVDGGGDPLVVVGFEALEGGVVLEGVDEVAGVDTAVGVESGEEARLGELVAPAGYEGFCDFGLGVFVGWEGGAD